MCRNAGSVIVLFHAGVLSFNPGNQIRPSSQAPTTSAQATKQPDFSVVWKKKNQLLRNLESFCSNV
jgi:hypothetical protein